MYAGRRPLEPVRSRPSSPVSRSASVRLDRSGKTLLVLEFRLPTLPVERTWVETSTQPCSYRLRALRKDPSGSAQRRSSFVWPPSQLRHGHVGGPAPHSDGVVVKGHVAENDKRDGIDRVENKRV